MDNMKSGKILCAIVAIFVFTFVLTGCTKCISTETSTVQVKIVDKYYRGAYTTPIFNGKTTTIVTHSATYRITVEYNSVKYNISSHKTYNKYYDKVGEYADGILETKKYDDGTEKYRITGLK